MSETAKLRKPGTGKQVLEVLPVDDPPAPVLQVLPVEEAPSPPALPQVLPVEESPAPARKAAFAPPPIPPLELSSMVSRPGWEAWLGRAFVRLLLGFLYAVDVLFGLASLVVALSVLAAIPILNFISLGYLLEASACVARTGKLRDGFPGVRNFSRLGQIVLGVTLMLLPLWLVSSFAQSAQIIEPDGLIARRWRWGLILLTVVLAVHIVIAIASGGRLWQFVFPFLNPFWLYARLRQGGYYRTASNAVWDFWLSLRLRHYFWLGLRGFLGGLIWLGPPVTLMAMGHFTGRSGPVGPLAFLAGWFGAFLLLFVLSYVPIVQVRFATENRFGAFLEFWAARKTFQRAPWAFAVSYVVTLAFAIPLFLLKIETVPAELTWIPTLFFIVLMYPARLLTGWAYGFAIRCPKPRRHWFFRWTGWVWLPPATLIYMFFLYFSQFTSWEGLASWYFQHAFMLPAPFVGM